MPAVGVGAGDAVEAALQRGARGGERRTARRAEAQCELQVLMAAPVELRLGRLHDVAVRRGAVVPVHPVVVAQVDPAVARVQVAHRGAAEGRCGDERAARLGVLGKQRAVGRGARVVAAVVAERRVDVGVDLVAGAR